MQCISVTPRSHLPKLAGAGHEPTLPPLALHPTTAGDSSENALLHVKTSKRA
jgi:hypothetical protein